MGFLFSATCKPALPVTSCSFPIPSMSAQKCCTAQIPVAVGQADRSCLHNPALCTVSLSQLWASQAALSTGSIRGCLCLLQARHWQDPIGTSCCWHCQVRGHIKYICGASRKYIPLSENYMRWSSTFCLCCLLPGFLALFISSWRRAHKPAAPSLRALVHAVPHHGRLPICRVCLPCCSAVLGPQSPARIWRD